MSKLYVAMVGLPARGKSTLARRIQSGLEQQGIQTAIFNNGDVRRKLFGAASAQPDFFDPNNADSLAKRREVARITMEAARQWLSTKGEVAILDATNGTLRQRQELLDFLNDFPVLFIECVNDDTDLLEVFIRNKTQLKEFAGMSVAAARAAFERRLLHYESVYTPLCREACWMRVEVADCRLLAEAPSNALPHYSAIRSIIISRWVNNLYLVRHGETEFNADGRIGGDPGLTALGLRQAGLLARHFRGVSLPYIFTSTRQRAVQMAAPLLEGRPMGTGMSMEEFDELDAGVCEGMTYAEVRAAMPEEYAARAADKYSYVYPGGESYAMLRERVARGIRKALFIAGEGSLLIVGHQAVNRAILSLFLAQRPSDVPFMYIPQNQFYHITVTQCKKLIETIRFA